VETDPKSDPQSNLLQLAGIEAGNREAFDSALLETALDLINCSATQRGDAKPRLFAALAKHRVRLPSVGEHLPAEEIRRALNSIENGLRQMSEGLATLDYARQTTVEAVAPVRATALEDAHRFVIGAICDAMPPVFDITDEQIANSVPTFSRMGFNNPWRSRFNKAADQVARGKETWAGDEFAMPRRTRSPERDELIADLATIFENITEMQPTAWRPAGNIGEAAKSLFHQFVERIWSATSEASAPSADVIRAALATSRPLHSSDGEQ
jgi:hypothetical protein